jgi:hypothetical protein
MKDIKGIFIGNVIILLISVLGAIFLKSNILVASSLFQLVVVIKLLISAKKKESKVFSILTSAIGLLEVIASLYVIYFTYLGYYSKESFLLILVVLLNIIIRYAVLTFYTTSAYQKRLGLISISYLNSNMDFIINGIIIATLVLTKCSKFLNFLSYGDLIGVGAISLVTIYYGLKLIVNSFNQKELEVSESFIEEIDKRQEVKKIDSISVFKIGGVRKLYLNVQLTDGMSLVNTSSFLVTLNDYLLKISDVGLVNMTNGKKRAEKVARNSRSGNSTKSTKKKNTRKKNKKR